MVKRDCCNPFPAPSSAFAHSDEAATAWRSDGHYPAVIGFPACTARRFYQSFFFLHAQNYPFKYPEGIAGEARVRGAALPLWRVSACYQKPTRRSRVPFLLSQAASLSRLALPDALDDEQRSVLTHEITQELSDLYGVAAIAAIHRPDRNGDDRNHHAHILFSTRTVEADEKLGAKVTSITSPKTSAAEVSRFREIVADCINDALEDAGSDERVDHRSFAERGIEAEPTIHLGPAASGMERRGEPSDRGDINRQIIEERLAWQRDQAEPEITATVEAELAARFGDASPAPAEPPHGIPDNAPPLPQGVPDDAPPIPTGVPDNAPPLQASAFDDAPMAAQGVDARGAEHSGFRAFVDRIHAWQERGLAFLMDETSGGKLHPRPSQEPHPSHGPRAEPEPAAEPEPPQGWFARGWGAVRSVFEGWRTPEPAASVPGAVAAAPHMTAAEPEAPAATPVEAAPPEDSGGGFVPPPDTEPGRDPARDGANVETPNRDDRPPEFRARPMSAFDALSASVDASRLQPPGKTPSMFDRVTAPREEPPARPAPDIAAAYEEALRRHQESPDADGPDFPEADSASAPDGMAFPEPDDAPSPEWHGPELDL